MTGTLQLAEIAAAVGERLGGLTLDQSWTGPGVRIGTEGDGLYLREPYNQPGRIEVSGWFPGTHYYFQDGERKHITVRADRGPAVIASEITSRLLPVYRTAMLRVRDHDAAEQAAQQARDTLAAHITALFSDEATHMPAHCQSSHSTEVIVHLPGLQGGKVKFSGDGSEVTFERFRVPAAVALRMLETIALLIPVGSQEK